MVDTTLQKRIRSNMSQHFRITEAHGLSYFFNKDLEQVKTS